MMKAIREYTAEYGWCGLITDRFSPTRWGLADYLRTIADRLSPPDDVPAYWRVRREMEAHEAVLSEMGIRGATAD
jgi:hypothetical protein